MLVKPPIRCQILPWTHDGEFFQKGDIIKYFRVSEQQYNRWFKAKLLKPVISSSLYFYRIKDIIKLMDKDGSI